MPRLHESSSVAGGRDNEDELRSAELLRDDNISLLVVLTGWVWKYRKLGSQSAVAGIPHRAPFFPTAKQNQRSKILFLISSVLSGARTGACPKCLVHDCLDEHVLAGSRKPTEAGYPFASDQTMDSTPHIRKGEGQKPLLR